MIRLIDKMINESIEQLYERLLKTKDITRVDGGWEWKENPGETYNACLMTINNKLVPTKPIFNRLLSEGQIDHKQPGPQEIEDQFFAPFKLVPKRVKMIDGKEVITDRTY